jgi:tetratricopeptide (TPR) repeat protein
MYTYEDAIEFKRSGEYEKARDIYVYLLRNEPTIDDARDYYYSLGKVQYLLQNYDESIHEYYQAIAINSLKHRWMLAAYLAHFFDDAFPGIDQIQMMQVRGFLGNYARHLGHAIMDPLTLKSGIHIDNVGSVHAYVRDIAGRENDRTRALGRTYPAPSPTDEELNAYEERCTNTGYNILHDIFKSIAKEQQPDLVHYFDEVKN